MEQPSADDQPTGRLAAVPVDSITEQAHAVRFGRTVAVLLAALLYGLGYGIATVFGASWWALVWCATAVRVGWTDARQPAKASEAP